MEDKQCLPELIHQRLEMLQKGIAFGMTPELVDRDYDCTDLDEKLCRLMAHVTEFLQRKAQDLTGEKKPPMFIDNAFTVMFHEEGKLPYCGRHYFSPEGPKELAPYLRGPDAKGSGNNSKTPKVKEAAEKGADYLVCRVPKWGAPWTEIVRKCFADFSYSNGVTYFSKDPRLDPLEGVVLFNQYDDFCIVNNLRARTRNWLAA